MSAPTGTERPSRKTASVADVRAGGQPPGLKDRRNEEHWAGRLYMRAVSPYFTWLFLRIGFSANQLTYLMIISGVLAGVVAGVVPGLTGALVTAVLVQLYLLLDCSDGEMARYTTDNVVVSRAKSGLPAEPAGGDRAARPRSSGLAMARQAVAALRFHRIIGAVELSLLILLAALLDLAVGGLGATRVLTVAVAVVAGVQTVLHFVSVVASRRLR